jgi:hypothetical protein
MTVTYIEQLVGIIVRDVVLLKILFKNSAEIRKSTLKLLERYEISEEQLVSVLDDIVKIKDFDKHDVPEKFEMFGDFLVDVMHYLADHKFKDMSIRRLTHDVDYNERFIIGVVVDSSRVKKMDINDYIVKIKNLEEIVKNWISDNKDLFTTYGDNYEISLYNVQDDCHCCS